MDTLRGNPWKAKFFRMFDSAQDSGVFIRTEDISTRKFERSGVYWYKRTGDDRVAYFPLYEGKMIWQYDHRAGTFSGLSNRPPRGASLPGPSDSVKHQTEFEVEPWYWVNAQRVYEKLETVNWHRLWSFGYRFGSNPTNARTMIASVIPISATPHVFPQVVVGTDVSNGQYVALMANMNALVVDYVCRTKMSRPGLDAFIVKQLPILSPGFYTGGRLGFLVERVLELTYTSRALVAFARDLKHGGAPYPWDEGRRHLLRADLDAFYARAYGLTRDELRYVLDPTDAMGADYPSETFRVLKNKETRQYGEYRTRELVLSAWDRMEASGEFRELGL